MATFVDNVFSAFEELQYRGGFVPSYAFSEKGSATLLKKLCKDVFLYLFVRDGRASNADLTISLWIAPPHEPGDGLDKLYIGFKILIASTYDVDDSFFRSSEQRVLNLVPHLQCLSEVVLQELKSPTFITQRFKTYKMERAAFDALQHITSAQDAIDSFTKLACSELATNDALAKMATEAAKHLIEQKGLSEEAVEFYGGDASFLGRSLVGLMYVHAITA